MLRLTTLVPLFLIGTSAFGSEIRTREAPQDIGPQNEVPAFSEELTDFSNASDSSLPLELDLSPNKNQPVLAKTQKIVTLPKDLLWFSFGMSAESEDSVAGNLLFGLLWSSEVKSKKSWEFGLRVNQKAGGYLLANRKFYLSTTATLRPYLRAGLSLYLKPEDQLASVLRYQQYHLMGGAGMEWSYRTFHLRTDIELGLAVDKYYYAGYFSLAADLP
ncbi:MAG: hypothetical protein COT74_07010 [Bdellovibrionales bacterium CG10_big_fil_rev_8_21_14_0_10_45_34]|nr:MAG: hypothetical protein COT74_07010 [Bdellovibrionales bacterium CG10_big_fil_rev_8_21_14_0_10_45_34]